MRQSIFATWFADARATSTASSMYRRGDSDYDRWTARWYSGIRRWVYKGEETMTGRNRKLVRVRQGGRDTDGAVGSNHNMAQMVGVGMPHDEDAMACLRLPDLELIAGWGASRLRWARGARPARTVKAWMSVRVARRMAEPVTDDRAAGAHVLTLCAHHQGGEGCPRGARRAARHAGPPADAHCTSTRRLRSRMYLPSLYFCVASYALMYFQPSVSPHLQQ